MKQNKEKIEKIISLQDGILILGILFLAVAAFVLLKWNQRTGYQVEISVDGKVVKTLSLDRDATYEVRQESGNNTVVIVAGEVTVSQADCPDKICKNHSPISKVGQTIICLPHRVVVEIVE